MNTETGATLKIKVLNVSKTELFKDLDKAVEFDQSQIFKKLYENEFGTPGGEPYGALIGDYEFTNHPEDIDLLGKMSNVAAAAFCPFISAAAPKLFGFENWTELSKPRDLEKIFDDGRVRQVEVVSAIGGLAVRHADDAARAGPAALRREHQAGRGVRLRGGRAGRKGRPSRCRTTSTAWMNAAYVHGHAADRRLRQVRLVHGHPRRRGRRQGRGPAGPHLHQRRRRRAT